MSDLPRGWTIERYDQLARETGALTYAEATAQNAELQARIDRGELDTSADDEDVSSLDSDDPNYERDPNEVLDERDEAIAWVEAHPEVVQKHARRLQREKREAQDESPTSIPPATNIGVSLSSRISSESDRRLRSGRRRRRAVPSSSSTTTTPTTSATATTTAAAAATSSTTSITARPNTVRSTVSGHTDTSTNDTVTGGKATDDNDSHILTESDLLSVIMNSVDGPFQAAVNERIKQIQAEAKKKKEEKKKKKKVETEKKSTSKSTSVGTTTGQSEDARKQSKKQPPKKG